MGARWLGLVLHNTYLTMIIAIPAPTPPGLNVGPSQVNSSDWSTFPLSYRSYREMQRRSG